MKRNRLHRQDRGVALIVALIILLILSTLTASLIFSSRTEIWSTSNYRLMMQSRYAAEAGAQNAINWLNNNNTANNAVSFDTTKSPVQYNGRPAVLSAMSGIASNYPDNAAQTAFSNAVLNQALAGTTNTTYSAYATLMSMRPIGGSYQQVWQVTSQGSITGVKAANVQIVETIEKNTSALQNFAVYATSTACSALSLDGNITTDSYNSSSGTYAATKQTTGGNIGTNGSMHGDSGDNIQGSLTTPQNPTTGSCPGAALSGIAASAVKGGIVRGSILSFPLPALPAQPVGNATSATVTYSGTKTLAPGTYGNVSLDGATIHVSAGTYNFNCICMRGNPSTIILDSGPVVFNIWGTNKSTGAANGQIIDVGKFYVNTGGVPSQLAINSLSSGHITMGDAWTLNAVINAPNASVDFTNSGDLYGSLIAGVVTPTSSTNFHFDTASSSSGVVGNYHVTSFNWSRF